MNTTEYLLPSHWASYLINGDASGLEDEEIKEIDSWYESEGVRSCVGVEEDGFHWGNDASSLGGDCSVYTFMELPC
jgi:hypothetical protein